MQHPGSSRGLPVGAGIRTHNLGLPRVSSPTLYPLGQRLPYVSHWVLQTVEKGYRIQFGAPPPHFKGVFLTLVSPKQALVLEQEIISLLRKEAIEVVPPLDRESGFYSPVCVCATLAARRSEWYECAWNIKWRWVRIEFPPGPDPDRSPDFEKPCPKAFRCSVSFPRGTMVTYVTWDVFVLFSLTRNAFMYPHQLEDFSDRVNCSFASAPGTSQMSTEKVHQPNELQ